MAKKKRKRKTSLKGKVMSAKGRKKSTRRRKKKGFLSEIFTPQSFQENGKGAISGMVGGGIAYVIERVIPKETNLMMKILILGGASIGIGAGLKAPKLAGGIAGALGYSLAQQLESKMLSEMEDTDYADDDSLEEYPDALDENGTPMFLSEEDGQFHYMEEFELSQGGEYLLSESFQDYQMYPRYVDSSAY